MNNYEKRYPFIAGVILGEYFSTLPKSRQPIIWIEEDLTLHIEEFAKVPDIIRFNSALELMKYAQDHALEDSDIPSGAFDTHYYLHEVNTKAIIELYQCNSWFSPAQDYRYWVEKDLTLHIYLDGAEAIGYRCADYAELARVVHEFNSGIQEQIFAKLDLVSEIS